MGNAQARAQQRHDSPTASDSAQDGWKATSSPPSAADVAAAVEAAYEKRPATGIDGSPDLRIEQTLNSWLADIWDAVYGHWPCSDENCPARPTWDNELWE